MHRKLFGTLCIVTVLMGTFAITQAQETGLVGRGIKAGLALSKFTGDDVDMPDPFEGGGDLTAPDQRLAFAAGGYLVYAFSPNLAFQPEALVVSKGAKYEGSGQVEVEDFGLVNVDWEQTLKLTYLEIPLLLRISPAPTASTRPFFLVGPSVGFKLSAKMAVDVTASAQGQSDTQEEEEDLDGVKSLDLGATVGAGLDIAAGEATRITLEARYTLGLTSIDDAEGDQDGVDVKNSTLMVMAGIGF